MTSASYFAHSHFISHVLHHNMHSCTVTITLHRRGNLGDSQVYRCAFREHFLYPCRYSAGNMLQKCRRNVHLFLDNACKDSIVQRVLDIVCRNGMQPRVAYLYINKVVIPHPALLFQHAMKSMHAKVVYMYVCLCTHNQQQTYSSVEIYFFSARSTPDAQLLMLSVFISMDETSFTTCFIGIP